MFDLQRFKELSNSSLPGKKLSIYIPTHRAGGTEKDAIRIKNALQEADQILDSAGFNPRERSAWLAPLEKWKSDEDWLRDCSDGVAIFIADDYCECYKVPINFEQIVMFEDEFYLRPMSALLESGKQKIVYFLRLSQDENALFSVKYYSMTPIEISDCVPASREAANRVQTPNRKLQHHESGGTVYHGQGGGEDQEKMRIDYYLNKVANGIDPILERANVPLMLGGVDYLVERFRNESTYPQILPKTLTGNLDEYSMADLHSQVLETLDDYFDSPIDKAVDTYNTNVHYKKASSELQSIFKEAIKGNIETLIVHPTKPVWGNMNETTGAIDVHAEQKADSVDLLDRAVKLTVRHGGSVMLADEDELPEPQSAANAIYRFEQAGVA